MSDSSSNVRRKCNTNTQVCLAVIRDNILDKQAISMSDTTSPGDAVPKHVSVKTRTDEEVEDRISQAVGEFGRWQLQLTFLLSLFNIPCTWHIFALTFQSLPSDFWCAKPPNLGNLSVDEWRNISHTTDAKDGKGSYNPCYIWDVDYSTAALSGHNNVSRACTQWQFDSTEFGETITEKWHLVCDRAQLVNVAEMMFLAGVAVGGLASGMVSDRFGRKRTLMGSLVLQICLAVIMAFSPWFELYLILRCFLGFISVSVVFSGFVLCMELVGGKWRTVSGVSYLFPVPLSYITIAGIAYFVRGWKELQLAITLPSVLLFGLWWVLPESPRWLLALGRTDEVMVILQEAARINNRPLPPNLDKLLRQDTLRKEPTDQPKAGIMDLFRTPNIRKNSLVLYIIWFSVYLVYYGLVLNLGNIGGDIYLNTVLSGIVEVPAVAISILFLLKMGRRWPLCLTLMGSGVACFLTLAIPPGDKSLQWVTITFAMVGKFSVSSSNAVMPVFTAELFPTVVRNLGVGSSNVPAGIALMLVPYLWNLSGMDERVPMGVLGAFGIVGGLSVLLLPETGDRPMAATLQEGEELPRSKRTSSAEKQRKIGNDGNCNGSFAS
ncbi:organic cation transporter protein-like isoform X2 [Zootermopsis nevadensis]|uniref:organic cation transporter protein-like isoform X2 n=1 Tax=Zootermopsis nevadensis TaxID=136037 RepID=UPI000B8EAA85|nr:organic cation transporter protein-like isoform X2 [Zootermopsis nevadensis]